MTRLWASLDIRMRALLIVIALIGAYIVWYLGSPLFINRTVNESFPAVSAPRQGQPADAMAATPADAMADSAMAATPADAMADSAMAATPADAMADSAMAATPADAMAATPADAMAATPADAMAATPADAMADSAMAATPADAMADSAPVGLSSGQFGAIDTIHKGEGKATIYQLPDGKHVLRFEGFKVTNGPDLYVYLSGHPAPRNGEQVYQDGFEVAQLKGNIGDQNYELPDGLDLSKIKSAVIYCKQFSVVFSTAELAAMS
jgi:Electron transfer DM13